MHFNIGGSSIITGVFFHPAVLLGLCLVCAKIARQSKHNNHIPPQPAPAVVVVNLESDNREAVTQDGKKKLYLTFDDGPNNGTSAVWHIVREEQVPVTFFIVGQHVFASHGQHAMWDSLTNTTSIELCNHSQTHAHNQYAKFYKSADTVIADFEKCKSELGFTNNIARTPGRNIWRIDTLSHTDQMRCSSVADSLHNAGFDVMGWDLEWQYNHKNFVLKTTAEQIMQQIDYAFSKNKLRTPDNLVLLAHDQVYKNAGDSAELHKLIRMLKERADIELMLASDYPGVKKLQSTGTSKR